MCICVHVCNNNNQRKKAISFKESKRGMGVVVVQRKNMGGVDVERERKKGYNNILIKIKIGGNRAHFSPCELCK